ncbi:hypothetical protein H4582DRAFT_1513574 [Lactarius indigo]|nr:hypothetical protein H4582DRAFT_1513574 [Lactarius indigo]
MRSLCYHMSLVALLSCLGLGDPESILPWAVQCSPLSASPLLKLRCFTVISFPTSKGSIISSVFLLFERQFIPVTVLLDGFVIQEFAPDLEGRTGDRKENKLLLLSNWGNEKAAGPTQGESRTRGSNTADTDGCRSRRFCDRL